MRTMMEARPPYLEAIDGRDRYTRPIVDYVRPFNVRHRLSFAVVSVALIACGHEARKVVDSVDRRAGEALPPPAANKDSVVITNLAPGEIEVASPSGSKVSTKTRVEQKDATGSWTPLEQLDLGNGYRLVSACDAPSNDCATLSASPLRPVLWQGFSCSSQCNSSCDKNVWEGPGTFRIVVLPCAGDSKATEIAGPAFDLPSHDFTGPAFDRWKLSTDVASATAVRLDGPDAAWSATVPAKSGSLAGFAERPDTARPLDSPVLAALVLLLQDPKGFDDKTAKRCAMKNLVGFRVTRNLTTTSTTPRSELVEIAIDFNCHKLFAVRGDDGRPRTVLATHFDPSSAGFASLAKKSLPTDKDLAAVR